jgi:4-oxalocrotonate tautomerase
MPLVRIDLIQGQPASFRQALGDVVYEAMLQTFKIPANDRFQVITEHPAENFIFDANYLGIARTPGCIFIQATISEGRTIEVKRAFYAAVASGLHARLGVRPEDVLINLVEVNKGNWSFGTGIAQYDPGT